MQRLVSEAARGDLSVYALLVRASLGSHRTLLASLVSSFGAENVRVDGLTGLHKLRGSDPHDIAVRLAVLDKPIHPGQARELILAGRSVGTDLLELGPGGGPDGGRIVASGTPEQLAAEGTVTGTCLQQLLG